MTTGQAYIQSMYYGTQSGEPELWAYWATCDLHEWHAPRLRHPTASGYIQCGYDVSAHNMRDHRSVATAVMDV